MRVFGGRLGGLAYAKENLRFSETVREVAETLINKGLQHFLPQSCPKIIIKIKQPNFVERHLVVSLY